MESAEQLDAIANQTLRCGRVGALRAGLMIEHDGVDHRWHPDWLLEMVGVFAESAWACRPLTEKPTDAN